MTPYYSGERVTLYLGDCVEVMRSLPDASVDAIVTDPPYELGFMGKGWDATGIANSVSMWSEALRILKPGGHLAAFGGTRTYHRMACAVEDAGFEIRDCLAWMYGSGFPKSLDVSKAIDRANGDERPVVGEWSVPGRGARSEVQAYGLTNDHGTITSAASAASAAWDGWGTALKPAYEPIVLARKPLAGTVAANVLQHGTGALNIDGCRIGSDDTRGVSSATALGIINDDAWEPRAVMSGSASGRWPANVLLDEEAAAILDAEVGVLHSQDPDTRNTSSQRSGVIGFADSGMHYGDAGGPSRFFYTAKSSRSEREAGLEEIEPTRRADAESRTADAAGSNNPRLRVNARHNDHPTVKPVDLMRWLCRLITPPGGLVLDPFLGSGTTGMVALDEGFRFVGIDREEHYLTIAQTRIAHRHLLTIATQEPTEAMPIARLL